MSAIPLALTVLLTASAVWQSKAEPSSSRFSRSLSHSALPPEVSDVWRKRFTLDFAVAAAEAQRSAYNSDDMTVACVSAIEEFSNKSSARSKELMYSRCCLEFDRIKNSCKVNWHCNKVGSEPGDTFCSDRRGWQTAIWHPALQPVLVGQLWRVSATVHSPLLPLDDQLDAPANKRIPPGPRSKWALSVMETVRYSHLACVWLCQKPRQHLLHDAVHSLLTTGRGAMYRIMYELAVCSDGMTEAQPRSFRQNRPASEYIIWHNAHSPANRCSGCSNTCTWIRKTCRLITLMQRSQDRFRFLLP